MYVENIEIFSQKIAFDFLFIPVQPSSSTHKITN